MIAEKVPITTTEDGVMRVEGTRIPLETLVYAFRSGYSPEQIVDSFDTLSLADVYSIIAYYLNHREEIDAYIEKQEQDAESVKLIIGRENPSMFALRERLQKLKRG